MKRKLRIAESEHLLYQCRANDLLRAHAFASFFRIRFSQPEQILANLFQDIEIGIEHAAHRNKLFGSRMGTLGCQRKLSVVEISHRGLGLVSQGGLAISPRNSEAPDFISMREKSDFRFVFMAISVPGRELA